MDKLIILTLTLEEAREIARELPDPLVYTLMRRSASYNSMYIKLKQGITNAEIEHHDPDHVRR